MNLPNLPANVQAAKREILEFGGVNYSDDAGSGEFAQCRNLSGRRLPYLTQRPARVTDKTYAEPEAVFAWDGKMVVASGGQLYYDGNALCSVLSGPKQFAVVNTKLIVWPDKLMVDLVDRSVTRMAASVINQGVAEFTANTVTLVPKPVYATAAAGSYQNDNGYMGPWVWTYSAVSWDEETGWTLEGADLTSMFDYGPTTSGRYYIPTATFNDATQDYTFGRPKTEVWSEEQPDKTAYPEPAPGNNIGFYGKLEPDMSKDNYIGLDGSYYAWLATYYWAQQENDADLTQHFAVGDHISVSGASNEANNGTMLKVTAVDGTTVTVEGAPFTEGTDQAALVLQKEVPPIDFICEKDNRLWGCANSQKAMVWNAKTEQYDEVTSRVIYSSALGMPDKFWEFNGLSTDSYQVAVASEGNFTGITNYGGGVLCWKENELVKILGGYPAEYTMYTYHIAGVEEGSHKSIANINERLFYKGRAGVYAYAGGTPALISERMGNHRFRNAVAASDGIRYYISMQENEEWNLFVYDTLKGLWFREDDTHAVDMCSVLGNVMILTAEQTIFRPDGDPMGKVDWMVQFAPFYETAHGRRSYSKVLLRMELTGWMKIETRTDDGRWVENAVLTGSKTVTVPIQPSRCDKFEIRISGEGTCTILSMVRVFKMGG